MPATLSILGLYNVNSTIFDTMSLPADINTNKSTLINNLLMECAEFEILYPDPEFMKNAIAAWSASMVAVWEKQLATTKFDYDPIANYNRFEFYKDITDGTIKTDTDITDTTTYGHTETQAQNSFENAGMVDAYKTTYGNKDDTRRAGYNSTDNDTTFTHDAHMSGNIGVTSTQDMIKQEREVVLYNMYTNIIEDFKMRFCLMIY